MDSIKWIFFDIGSTLIDKNVAYRKGIEKTIAGTKISFNDFYGKMVAVSKHNQNAYNKVLESYGLTPALWNSEDEYVYSEAESCLCELSERYKIGIIANQSLGSKEHLEKLGLLKYIELIIASAEEGVAKSKQL